MFTIQIATLIGTLSIFLPEVLLLRERKMSTSSLVPLLKVRRLLTEAFSWAACGLPSIFCSRKPDFGDWKQETLFQFDQTSSHRRSLI